ncbi:tyrosyl-DNA phosphodiesterase-domain-containing protein [Mycena rebaudengoi]|nr:tyrosyl-DNA phosphodiesterase-domain-containing protein [Mycena rebaudengoi]
MSSDDEDLARAIAVSLEESKQGKVSKTKSSHHEVVEISSDEDEDVAPPPRKSGADKLVKSPVKSKAPAVAVAAGAGPLSLLSDRAQLEKERLARQKRLRPNPSPPPPESDDASDATSDTDGSARKKPRLSPLTGPTRALYPAGALFRVATQHVTVAATPAIRLSEILGNKEELVFAVLSAFVSDPAWLYAFFDPGTPVVLVGHPDDADGRKNALKNIFPNWVRVCPPLRDGRGCMHMKYMLLFGKDGGLRVVVGTANLVPMDWRDIENYVYIVDVPLAHGAAPTTTPRPGERKGESFPLMLERTLRATGVDEALRIMQMQGHDHLPLPSLDALSANYDWRAVRAALVPSVPGRWEGWGGREGVLMTGQPRLMRAVQVLGCAAEGANGAGDGKNAKSTKGKAKADKDKEWGLELECLTSSIGTYTPAWLAAFRLCAAGRAQPLEKWLDRAKGRGKASTPAISPTTRILFPTLATVRATVLGEAGAGTVFCRRGQWTGFAKGGVQGLFSDAKSRSGGVGMHTKMILGTLVPPAPPPVSSDISDTESESDSDIEIIEAKPAKGKGKAKEPKPEPEPKPYGWAYVGSHNFTPSAWGTLSGSGFNPVVNVTNYELGVVIPLATRVEADAAVAWERPARKYGSKDVPWIQEESPFFAP